MFVFSPEISTVNVPYSVVIFNLPVVTASPLLSLTITSILTFPTVLLITVTSVIVGINLFELIPQNIFQNNIICFISP